MNIATSKQSPKIIQKIQSSSEARFDKAWLRVANQQKKNARLREEVQDFAQRVSAAIQGKSLRRNPVSRPLVQRAGRGRWIYSKS